MILFGVLFAVFTKPTVRRAFYRETAFWHGLIFSSLFNVAVVYAVILYPDWMWMYYPEDSRNSVTELIYIFVFIYYLPYLLGYYLGRDVWAFSKILWALLLVSLALSELWIIHHLFDRYSVTGTRAEYLAGTAISLFDPANPIGPVMNGSVVLMAIYFFIVVYLNRKQKKF